jgi:hypothetical protein
MPSSTLTKDVLIILNQYIMIASDFGATFFAIPITPDKHLEPCTRVSKPFHNRYATQPARIQKCINPGLNKHFS